MAWELLCIDGENVFKTDREWRRAFNAPFKMNQGVLVEKKTLSPGIHVGIVMGRSPASSASATSSATRS